MALNAAQAFQELASEYSGAKLILTRLLAMNKKQATTRAELYYQDSARRRARTTSRFDMVVSTQMKMRYREPAGGKLMKAKMVH